ncbi:unnamed protein product [Dibothriocephalus latus]|uniref:Uncharacterized protein n=1 Tax=Dibothriocephalus latus TaxID=60516 RepID=A0A3P7NHY6_DIBLA|nr:unnamed protein product [Dibothriocephalus latus]
METENSPSFQDFRGRNLAPPSQLQYSAEAAQMEMFRLPSVVGLDGPSLRSIEEYCEDDDLVRLQFVYKDPGALVPADIHQHDREHEIKKCRREDVTPLHSIRHCEGFGNRLVVRDARHHPILELTNHVDEVLEAADFPHEFPWSVTVSNAFVRSTKIF